MEDMEGTKFFSKFGELEQLYIKIYYRSNDGTWHLTCGMRTDNNSKILILILYFYFRNIYIYIYIFIFGIYIYI